MSLRSTMMESTCNVLRPTIGRDGSQGTTQSHKVITSNLACSAQQAHYSITMLYAQRNASVDTVLYFDVDPKCEPNDRIDVTDRTENVTSYLVTGRAQPVGRGRLWMAGMTWIGAPGGVGTPASPY